MRRSAGSAIVAARASGIMPMGSTIVKTAANAVSAKCQSTGNVLSARRLSLLWDLGIQVRDGYALIEVVTASRTTGVGG